MELDLGFAWIMTGVLAAVALISYFYSRSFVGQEKALFLLWQRSGLQLSQEVEEMEPSLKRGLRKRSSASWLGAFFGVLVAAAGLLVVPSSSAVDYVVFALVPATFVGSIGAEVWVALRDTVFHPVDSGKRIARIRSVRLIDYVRPVLVWMAPFFVIVAVALALGAMGVGAKTPGGIGEAHWGRPLAAVAVSLVVMALCFGISRRVLLQPQPAKDREELMWDDAMRATLLLKLFQLTAVLATYAASMALQSLISVAEIASGSQPSGYLDSYVFPLYFIPLFIFGRLWATGYFVQKLWSNGGTVNKSATDSASA